MKSIKLLAAASAMALAVPASAATLYTVAGTGQIAIPGSYSFSANAGAGAGTLNFYLDGYGSVDGDNTYRDVFTLSFNGTDILSLTESMGGGGANVVYLNTNGASITGGAFGGTFDGGQLQISLPVTLLNGANTFGFSYSAPGPDNLGGQPLSDEAWGLSKLTLSGNPMGRSVPEPATWAMMLAGFGLMGAAMRRKQNVSVRFA